MLKCVLLLFSYSGSLVGLAVDVGFFRASGVRVRMNVDVSDFTPESQGPEYMVSAVVSVVMDGCGAVVSCRWVVVLA